MRKLTALALAAVFTTSAAFAGGTRTDSVTIAPVQKVPDATFVWDDPSCPGDSDVIPMDREAEAVFTSITPDIWPYYRRCTGTAYAALRLDPHTAKQAVARVINAKCLTLDAVLAKAGVTISDADYNKILQYVEIVKTPLPGRYLAYEVTCFPAPEIWTAK